MSEPEVDDYYDYDVQTSDRPVNKQGVRGWTSEVFPDYCVTYEEAKYLAASCLKDCGQDNPKRVRIITRHHVDTYTTEEFKPGQL